MADRYLLESGAPDGFTLEDGSGVLLLEEGTAAVADDSDSFFSGFQRAVVGIALAAAAILPVQAAQRVVSQPQDEVPYATGTGIGYGTPQRGFRATNSPKFHLWAQGDDLPVAAAPTIVEETEFQPQVFKTEFKLSGPVWDDQFPRYGIEEDYSWGYWKAEEKVTLLPQSKDSDLPVTPAPTIVEDESFIPWANPPIPDSRVWSEGDELPTLTYLDEEGWVPVWKTPSPVFSLWDQPEEIVPQPATTIFSDEGEFQPPVFVPKALFKVWEDTDEWPTPVTSLPFEEDWDYTFLSRDSATYIVWATDEEIIPQPAVSQGGGVGHEEVKVFQWYQGDDLPVQATTIGFDEESWIPASAFPALGKYFEPSHQDEAFSSIAEEDFFSPWGLTARFSIPAPWQDEEIVPQPVVVTVEEDYWLGTSISIPGPVVPLFSEQDEIFPVATEEESYSPWGLKASYSIPNPWQDEEIVPQPPEFIEITEDYWQQPPFPVGLPVKTSWDISICIDEEFPELFPEPTVVDTKKPAGKAKKYKKRYQVEIDGQVFNVKTKDEVYELLEKAKELAKEQAKTVVERAQKAVKRPARKVLADARKSLVPPEINVEGLMIDAEKILRDIEDIYNDAFRTVEITTLLRRKDDDDDDEEALLMLL